MKFAGELLIFVLLLVTTARVFFVKEARRESIVVVVPVCFFLSFLLVFSWGFDLFTFFAVIFSFIVLLTNFHAFIRYSSHLFIDHYSPLMKFWSVFNSIILVSIIGILFYFAPVEFRNEKLKITETETRIKGSFRAGFEKAGPFVVSAGSFYEFIPENKETCADMNVIFISDKRGDVYNYKPFLQNLAAKGYKVYTADFFADDCRWLHNIFDKKVSRRFVMVIESILNNFYFMSQREFYTYNSMLECQTIYDYVNSNQENAKFFLISDVMANTAISDFQKTHRESVKGIFNLDSIPEYTTPGYGCIAYSDPLLNYVLGNNSSKRAEELGIIVEAAHEKIQSVISETALVF